MTTPSPGKFEANESLEISEFLLDIIGSGMTNDSLGEVEGFGFYSLIDDLDWFKTNDDLRGYSNTDKSWEDIKEVADSLRPAYIVHEDNNGFFTYTGFDSNEAARKAWKALTEDYVHFQKWAEDEVSIS